MINNFEQNWVFWVKNRVTLYRMGIFLTSRTFHEHFWTFLERYRPFHKRYSAVSETVKNGERSGTSYGLKRLQHHVKIHKQKNHCTILFEHDFANVNHVHHERFQPFVFAEPFGKNSRKCSRSRVKNERTIVEILHKRHYNGYK